MGSDSVKSWAWDLIERGDGWSIPDVLVVADRAVDPGGQAASARMSQPSRTRPQRDDRDPVRAAHGVPVERAERDGHLLQLVGASTLRRVDRGGVFERAWVSALADYDEFVGVDWRWLSMDGAMTKAPLGGKKTGPNPTDRAKGGTKRSLLTEANGVPLAVVVAGANRNDFKLARETLESIVIARPKPTSVTPQGLCLDKGYDYSEVRDLADEFRFTAHIRCRGEEARAIKKSRTISGASLGGGAQP